MINWRTGTKPRGKFTNAIVYAVNGSAGGGGGGGGGAVGAMFDALMTLAKLMVR